MERITVKNGLLRKGVVFHELFTLIFYYTEKDQRVQFREEDERSYPHYFLCNFDQPVLVDFRVGWFFYGLAALPHNARKKAEAGYQHQGILRERR